jgi:hypothetical protein
MKENECEELCVDDKTYKAQFQECNGKCISKYDACPNNKDDGAVEVRPRSKRVSKSVPSKKTKV